MKKQKSSLDKANEVIATVVSQKGTCAAGHKVGDQVVLEGLQLKGYICPSAFAVLYRYMYAMKFGAKLPFADMIRIACPDANNPVVFELRTE